MKKKVFFVAGLLFSLFFMLNLVSATNINSCRTLSSPDTYTLTQNVSSSGTCISITAEDVTLDCDGFTINFSSSSIGYGVYSNSNNTNVKNCFIQQTNSSLTNSHGIIFNGSSATNGTINNNAVTVSGEDSNGIFLSNAADYNNITNSAAANLGGLRGNGIMIDSSYNNIINVTGNAVWGAYYGILVSDNYNNFINVNGIASFTGFNIQGGSYNNFTNCYAQAEEGFGNAIRVYSGTQNSFINSVLNSAANSIEFESNPSVLNLINCSLTGAVTIGRGKINRFWYAGIHTVNSIGSDLGSVTINASNVNGTSIFNGTTNSTGWLATQTIQEYMHNSTGIFNYTPHWFNATKTFYIKSDVIQTVSSNVVITITLNSTSTSITSIAVTPIYPLPTQNVSCNLSAVDATVASMNVTGNWTKNGAIIRSFTYNNLVNNTFTIVANLTNSNYTDGDNISCQAIATGTNASVLVVASNINILSVVHLYVNSGMGGIAVGNYSAYPPFSAPINATLTDNKFIFLNWAVLSSGCSISISNTSDNNTIASVLINSSDCYIQANFRSSRNIDVGATYSILSNDSRYCAFPGLTRLPSGALYTSYRCGSDHLSRDGAIYSRISIDEGKTWQPEQLIYNSTDAIYPDARDAELMTLKNGKILLTFMVYNQTLGTQYIIIKMGTPLLNNSINWTNEIYINPTNGGFTRGNAVTSKVIELANGKLILPIYGSNVGEQESSGLVGSIDEGITWGNLTVTIPGNETDVYNEANGLQLPNGQIILLVRHEVPNNDHHTLTVSNDNGTTWSSPNDVLYTAAAGRPEIIRLSSGAIFWIGRGQDEYGNGGGTSYKTSWDNGLTWTLSGEVYGGGGSMYSSVVLLSGSHVATINAYEMSSSSAHIDFHDFYDTNMLAIQNQTTFVNGTSSFNATATAYTINGTVVTTNISTTAGTCVQVSNSTDGNNFTVTYTCSGSGETGINMGFTDNNSNYDFTTTAYNTYPDEITNPYASFGINPANNYVSNLSNITFDFKCSSNVSISTIKFYTNTTLAWEANYSNSSYTNGTWLNITLEGIPEGTYKWAVYCNDSDGNTDWTNTNRTFSFTLEEEEEEQKKGGGGGGGGAEEDITNSTNQTNMTNVSQPILNNTNNLNNINETNESAGAGNQVTKPSTMANILKYWGVIVIAVVVIVIILILAFQKKKESF